MKAIWNKKLNFIIIIVLTIIALCANLIWDNGAIGEVCLVAIGLIATYKAVKKER